MIVMSDIRVLYRVINTLEQMSLAWNWSMFSRRIPWHDQHVQAQRFTTPLNVCQVPSPSVLNTGSQKTLIHWCPRQDRQMELIRGVKASHDRFVRCIWTVCDSIIPFPNTVWSLGSRHNNLLRHKTRSRILAKTECLPHPRGLECILECSRSSHFLFTFSYITARATCHAYYALWFLWHILGPLKSYTVIEGKIEMAEKHIFLIIKKWLCCIHMQNLDVRSLRRL